MGLAGAVIGAGALTAGASLLGANKAASANQQAANLQAQIAAQNAARLQPFVSGGADVFNNLLIPQLQNDFGLTTQSPSLLTQAQAAQPGQMTQAQLEATPGYQFNLAQGLKSTQSAAAARGLGVSGAALKGAANFATGLADSTYQNQFNNAQTRFQNLINLNTAQQGNVQGQYQRLLGASTLGENAGAQTGAQSVVSGATQGNLLQAAGTAGAAGLAGVGNSANSGINNFLALRAFQNAGTNTGTGGFNAGAAASGAFGGSNPFFLDNPP